MDAYKEFDAFQLRDDVVREYRDYVEGYIKIKDPQIRDVVNQSLDDGLLAPAPILQLNPAYQDGESIDELVADGVLHPDCKSIFVNPETGAPLRFYKHQTEAFRRAARRENYVLTTGTGSGKSLAYIVPIVDSILRDRPDKGVQAIIVYPMNALANSQINELEKFLNPPTPFGGRMESPVRFKRYTGQESLAEREEMRKSPPHILLTNYMMLELILTRKKDVALVEALKNLKFLVFDELHTYRGREGADVALLARRVVDASGATNVVRVGASATMASEDDQKNAANEVAKVASALFGAQIKPENVVGEFLARETPERNFNDANELQALRREVELLAQAPDDEVQSDRLLAEAVGATSPLDALRRSSLASWLESNLGVERDEKSGTLRRRPPRPIRGDDDSAAKKLSKEIDLPEPDCAKAIKRLLLRGAKVKNESGRAFFAFRLHQFVGRGENAYATAELGPNRRVFMQKQVFAPGSERQKRLYPLVFCAHCGREFYCVFKRDRAPENAKGALAPGQILFEAREPSAHNEESAEQTVGYLYLPEDQSGDDADMNNRLREKLPDDWKDPESGEPAPNREKDLPTLFHINALGENVAAADPGAIKAAFIPSPFRFCPECGVAYAPSIASRRSADAWNVSSLGVGGRSAATTLLAVAVEENMLQFFPDVPGDHERDAKNRSQRKLLSFTDNRQDASLQAGHFNDFVEVGVIRGALYKALVKAEKEGKDGLTYDDIAAALYDALGLELKDFAKSLRQRADDDVVDSEDSPTTIAPMKKRSAVAAFKQALKYRVLRDLKRGWRVLLPNLEQAGLLTIDYPDVADIVDDALYWDKAPDALKFASQETRTDLLRELLNLLRRELAVDAAELDLDQQTDILATIKNHVDSPLAFDENEQANHLDHAKFAHPYSKPNKKNAVDRQRVYESESRDFYVSARGIFGRYVKKLLGSDLSVAEAGNVIEALFDILSKAGVLVESHIAKRTRTDGEPIRRYQISATSILWRLNKTGVPEPDVLRQIQGSEEGGRVNKFFQNYYKDAAVHAGRLSAKEHTAQVQTEERQKREKKFRDGDLPVLFCSPTMELGVDISTLNVVHMRNIPPTPANYAQRSGRAGRSGRSALTLVYASAFSQHDRYYFKRPSVVVSGAVKPPQIDLTNEDLILSHLRAIWLAAAVRSKFQFELGSSLEQVIRVPENDSSEEKCELKSETIDVLNDLKIKRDAFERAYNVFSPLWNDPDLEFDFPFNRKWIEEKLKNLEADFRDACKRWLSLYENARAQRNKHHERAGNRALSPEDKEESKRIRAQAEYELKFLLNQKSDGKGSYESENLEFNPYRYFAAEGFLPGYNFPRLPVVAYLPARTQSISGPSVKSEKANCLSRPRFLAISEFGPRAFIYHEGARYEIERVMLPIDERGDDGDLLVNAMRVCENCGYCHEGDRAGLDVCENCGATLGPPIKNLLELQKVSARRRDRINCNEEERQRLGYNVETSYRFATRDGEQCARDAEIQLADGSVWGSLKYGAGASIYRMNRGFRSAKDPQGYLIDLDTGKWLAKSQESQDDKDPLFPAETRANQRMTIPYVRDVKNCLVVEPASHLAMSQEDIKSLQAALRRAIERVFSIEDAELAAFPLPNATKCNRILFYEAAEGGAGVLRRLLNREKFNEVVREALEVAHYDPETGEDRKDACEAACYDCLLSYYNQPDHEILDRRRVRDPLLALREATLSLSSGPQTRTDRLNSLKEQTETNLEKEWLDFIEEKGLRLPTYAQYVVASIPTRLDFFYTDESGTRLAVYVDGPPHDYPEQAADDQRIRARLDELGYDVAVFRYDERDKWLAVVEEFAAVFGFQPK